MLYTNEKAKPQLYYDMSMQKALFSFLYCKSGNLYMDSMRMMDQGFLVFNFNKAESVPEQTFPRFKRDSKPLKVWKFFTPYTPVYIFRG